MSEAGQDPAKQTERPKLLGVGRGMLPQSVVEERRRRKSTS
jgi:hypothetical protein